MSEIRDAFMKTSRFKCTGIVIDLDDLAVTPRLPLMVQSDDAVRAIFLARQMKARFLVLAGQLHRKKGGVFSAIVPNDDSANLCAAAVAAHARLTEFGETDSLWYVFAERWREEVLAALGVASGTSGSA